MVTVSYRADQRRDDGSEPVGPLGNNLGQMRVQFNARTYVVEPDDNQVTPISVDVEEDGVPVACYSEYDYLTGRKRREWTTVVEFAPRLGPLRKIENTLEQYADVVNRIRLLISNARVSRPQRIRK